MTIQEALEGWFLHLRADNVSTQTLDRYARVWRQFGACLAARNGGNSRRAEGQLSVARKIASHTGASRPCSLPQHASIVTRLHPVARHQSWCARRERIAHDPAAYNNR
jgi:hypothetical protein